MLFREKGNLMRVVTAREMRQIDKKATQKYGIPPIVLMENAAIVSAFCVLHWRASLEVSVLVD